MKLNHFQIKSWLPVSNCISVSGFTTGRELMSQLWSHTCCHLLSHFSVSQWRTPFFFQRKKYSWIPSVCETGQAGNNRDNLTQTVEPGVSQPSQRLINPWVTPSLLLSFSWLLPKRFLGQPRTRFQPENVCSTCVRKWIVRGALRAWKKSERSLQSASGEFQILISLSYIRCVQKEWALIG